MRTSDLAPENVPNMDERAGQLIKAAKLVRSWIVAQRAAWPDAPPRPAIDPPASVSAPSGTAWDRAPVVRTHPAALDAAPEPSVTRDLFTLPRPAAPDLFTRLPTHAILRWSLRAIVAAACLAFALVAGAKGLASWSAWRNTPATGTAVLESDPPGSLVSVDGAALGSTPVRKELAAGHHLVEFHRRAITRTLQIDVVTGQSTVARIDWNQVRTGRLEVQSDPMGARVIIDGADRGVTPLSIDAMPIGSHAVALVTDRGSLEKTVIVTETGTALVNEAIYSGWLRVSSPIELDVRDVKGGIRLDERHQALIAPGPHDLRFENRALGFSERRHVDVRPGETTTISIEPPPSKLTVTATTPAEVMIDGERVGETPLTDYPVNIGLRDITISSASGIQRQVTLTVTVAPARINVDFSTP